MNRFLQWCRSIHMWLGVFIAPWVLIIGFTGFYLNHPQAVLGLIGGSEFSEEGFDAVHPPQPIEIEDAEALARRIAPDKQVRSIELDSYHGRPSYWVEMDDVDVVLSVPTGHYYVKTDFQRLTYAPDGELLHTKTYWGPYFKELHVDGWIGGGMGAFFADAVALGMILFGVSGLILFLTPRLRRLRRRLAKQPAAARPAE